jgi:serine/threonine protein phosphatase PrpC
VRRELAEVEDLIRALSDGNGDPTAGPKQVVLTAQGRRWRRLRDLEMNLQKAINDNYAARGALEDGPGSGHQPHDPPLPTQRESLPPHQRPGPLQSGTLPGRLQNVQPDATHQVRFGFDVGETIAGRTDQGHPANRNFDAMAGAVTADGRLIAIVADQQGYADLPVSVSQVAVTAAMAAALHTDPNLPAEQIAQAAFDAAAEATASANSSTTLLVVVTTPTGHGTTRVAFVWVGDSRGYLVTPDDTQRVTTDHTWSATQTVEAPPAEYPVQYVTRWIGRGVGHQPDVETRELAGPATIVLTTDELHDFYPNQADLGAIVRDAPTPGQAADDLIDHVLIQGSGNKTTIVIRLDPSTVATG